MNAGRMKCSTIFFFFAFQKAFCSTHTVLQGLQCLARISSSPETLSHSVAVHYMVCTICMLSWYLRGTQRRCLILSQTNGLPISWSFGGLESNSFSTLEVEVRNVLWETQGTCQIRLFHSKFFFFPNPLTRCITYSVSWCIFYVIVSISYCWISPA